VLYFDAFLYDIYDGCLQCQCQIDCFRFRIPLIVRNSSSILCQREIILLAFIEHTVLCFGSSRQCLVININAFSKNIDQSHRKVKNMYSLHCWAKTLQIS
jgi:hypothetical protein